MQNKEAAHRFGRVCGHLETIEHALQTLLKELDSGTAMSAGAALRTREALVKYRENKADWVRSESSSQEDMQIAEAIHRGLKAGRAQAVAGIIGDNS